MKFSPDAFYSDKARELAKWSMQERDRMKSLRIYKVALSLEMRYRDAHQNIVNDPYHKAVSAFMI